MHGAEPVRPGEVFRGVPDGAASGQDTDRGVREVNYEEESSARKIVAVLINNHRILLSIY